MLDLVVDVAEVLQREQIRSDRPQRDPLTATQTELHPRTLSLVARSYVVSGSGMKSVQHFISLETSTCT